jgi:hypothetical protein
MTKLIMFVAFSCSTSHAVAQLAFSPRQTITTLNADRIETTYKTTIGRAGITQDIIDPVGAISNVGIDATSDRMYIQRRAWGGLRAGAPVGISTIELVTGRQGPTVRIPEKTDLSGEARGSSDPSYFAFSHKRVYLESYLKEVVQGRRVRPRFSAQPAIVCLDLTKDNPSIASRDLSLAPHPETGDDRLLLWKWTGASRSIAEIQYLTLANGRVSDSHLLSRSETPLHISGAAGKWILSLTQTEDQSDTLVVFEVDEGKAVARGVRIVGRQPSWDAVDQKALRWITAGRSRTGRIVSVYGIPELNELGQLPSEVWGRMAVLPGTSLLAIVPEERNTTLVLVDLDTGKVVVERPLPPFDVTERGPWVPLVESSNRYVGAHGSASIMLFAIRN